MFAQKFKSLANLITYFVNMCNYLLSKTLSKCVKWSKPPFSKAQGENYLGHKSYTGQPRYLKVQGNGENTSSYPKFDIYKQNVTSPQYDVHVQFL